MFHVLEQLIPCLNEFHFLASVLDFRRTQEFSMFLYEYVVTVAFSEINFLDF